MALFGDVGKLFFGSKDKTKKLDTMTPEQKNLLNQMMQMLSPQGQVGEGFGMSMDVLQDWLDPNGQAYQRFAQPYMDEFNQQTIPGLSERFAGMGGGMGGGLSSSGFGQSLSAAGGNLQNQLAQLKSGLMGQAAQGLMGQYNQMSGQSLGAKPFGYQHTKGGPGLFQNMLSGYASQGLPGMGGLFSKMFGM